MSASVEKVSKLKVNFYVIRTVLTAGSFVSIALVLKISNTPSFYPILLIKIIKLK